MFSFFIICCIIAIIMFFSHIFDGQDGNCPLFFIPVILSIFSGCWVWQTTDHIDIEPVSYKTIVYPDTVYVITDARESFSTDKKVDYDNWSKEYPGQIWKAYNYFGYNLSREFHVKVPIE